ncbi:hypothetical protein BpHYR1_014117 [Brachionus plicatilis]|uniref:Uncharacterized protein n=1 Tax=Brachionus plicatilis TaxID=10195 RepID=A0A3M7RRK0_BRAPC|nr:hypothetical protein BpHYR1_014117 [Brachionus plicatilis]
MNIIYFYEFLTDAFSDLFRPQKIDHNQNIQLDFFFHLELSLFRSVHLRRPQISLVIFFRNNLVSILDQFTNLENKIFFIDKSKLTIHSFMFNFQESKNMILCPT